MRFSSSSRGLLALTLVAGGVTPAVAQYISSAPTAPIVNVSPAENLARSVRILAAKPRDFPALLAAGRAGLELGDLSAAAGFFARADEIRPTDPAPKVGMGGALVLTGDARGALDWFAQAQRLGANQALLGADRGLAHDLLGQQATAQADYRAALAGPTPDEARRRLALSLAIGGRMGEGLTALQPLLNRREPAAQRVRAFVLALGGQKGAAIAAIDQAMPGTSAGIGRFFDILPQLSAVQKAAAVHLGVFPTASEMALMPSLPVVVLSTPTRSARTAQPSFTPPLGARRSSPLPSEIAAATAPARVAPAPPTPRPRVVETTEESLRPVASIGGFSGRRRVRITAEPVPPLIAAVPARKAPERVPETVVSLAPPPPPPVAAIQSYATIAPPPRPAFSTAVSLTSDGPAEGADRLSGIDRLLATTREPLEPLAGNSLRDPAPDEAPQTDTPNSDPRVAARKAAAEKKTAAEKKVAADEKAAVKKAADKAAAAEKVAVAQLGVRGDHWVQLAGGTNRDRMSTEFARIKAKKPALFTDRAAHVSAGKDYFRLLIGPFADSGEAHEFANKLAKAGIDGFSWPRTPAAIRIERLASK